MKKYIHFFGCSFTAGQELADDEFFPQATDCKTAEEYYKLTSPHISNNLDFIDMNEYIERCKSLAYPNLIEQINPDWKCVNHAEFGSSIRQSIYNAIVLIEKNEQPIDFIVFQIPHYTREFVLDYNEKLRSYSINYPLANNNAFNDYLEKSVMFHSLHHWTIQGLVDMLLFEGYLISKNIKHIFLNLERTNAHSERLMKKFWRTKLESTIDLSLHILGRTVGKHFDQFTHQNFANVVEIKIKKII